MLRGNPAAARPRWIVINQSLSPTFLRLIERLAANLGPVEVWTGTPFPTSRADVVVRVLPSYDRGSLPRRAASWGAFAMAGARRLLQQEGAPFVLAVTNPPVMPQVVWAAAKLKGLRFGVLVWDLYPDHVVRIGLAAEGSPWVRAWTKWNGRVFEEASVVVTLGPQMAEAVGMHMPKSSREVEVIPNWAEVDRFVPLAKAANPFAIEHHLANRTVVMYSGNLGASHDLLPMLEAARHYQTEDRLRFVVVGDGLGLEEVRAYVHQHRLKNLLLLPRQSWETLPHSLACADIAVVSQAAGSEHLSVPSKTYSALAVGSAIAAITKRTSDLATLVNGSHSGFVAESASEFIHGLQRLVDDPQILAAMRAQARRLAVQVYSEDAVSQLWHEALRAHIAK